MCEAQDSNSKYITWCDQCADDDCDHDTRWFIGVI